MGDDRAKQVNKALSLAVIILLVIEASLTSILIPQFGDLFVEINNEIPLLTKFILFSPYYIWCLPFLGISIYRKNKNKLHGGGYGYLAVFIAGTLWIPLAVYGLYLPVIE